MIFQKLRIIGITFLAGLAVLFGWLFVGYAREFGTTKIVFLDVGQGDAILISQGTNQILIDGGRDGNVLLERLSAFVPFWDTTIETVVETHPDEDHIGGLLGLIDRYRVGVVLESGAMSKSGAYRTLEEKINENDIRKQLISKGTKITLPNGGIMEVLHPLRIFENQEVKDTNATSVVMRFETTSERSFLLTGDLPSEQENLIDTGDIDVLKVGHHGSKSSTSEAFLDRIKPEQAILSVGADNRYGHPAQEIIDRLQKRDMQIFRTDKQGNIVYTCPSEPQSECEISFGVW